MWQYILIFLGLGIAAILIGLLIGYVVLRLQKRPWPWSRPFSREPVVSVPQREPSVPEIKVPSPPFRVIRETVVERRDPLLEFIKSRTTSPASTTLRPEKSALVREIEANLAIALNPTRGKLTAFQTAVHDTSSKINSLMPETRDELREAYTDMRLANTLVSMSQEGGHRARDIEQSYNRLCGTIADRLQKVIPSLPRYG